MGKNSTKNWLHGILRKKTKEGPSECQGHFTFPSDNFIKIRRGSVYSVHILEN